MKIIEKTNEHVDFIAQDMINLLGYVDKENIENQHRKASLLNGFLIEEEESILGILLYHIEIPQCELVYMHSLANKRSVGKILLEKLFQKVEELKFEKIWTITTNDDVTALAFLQKNGFKLNQIYFNEMEKIREKNSAIPKIGKNNIPLRDMIELSIDF